MKISTGRLKSIYQLFIEHKSSKEREHCPAVEGIASFFSSDILENEKLALIDHVGSCIYCNREFRVILHFEKVRMKEIFPSQKKRLFKALQKKFNIFLFRQKYMISNNLYSLLFISLLVFLSFIIFIRKTNNTATTRSIFFPPIAIQPIGSLNNYSFFSFKWKEYETSQYYLVELFDDSLELIWRSERIYDTAIILPLKISSQLVPNKSYYWILTATHKDGTKVETDMLEFNFKN